jgi:hypothetical protein
MASKARMAKMFLPVAAVVALATACPNGDATPGQVVEAMTNAGLDEDEAGCIGNQFDRSFTQEELNEIGGASDLDDVPTDLAEEVRNILGECLDGSDGDATDEDDGNADDGGDGNTDAGDGDGDVNDAGG